MRGSLPVFFCIFAADGTVPPDLAPTDVGERIEFERVRDALISEPDSRIALVAPAPADLLAQRLQTVSDPARALERTCGDVAAVLKAFRQARRRIVLLDFAQCVRRPNRFSAALQAWAEGKPPELVEAEPFDPHYVDALAKIIALAMIASDREAARLAEEYEASLSTLEAAHETSAQLARQAALQWRAGISPNTETSAAPDNATGAAAITDLNEQRMHIVHLQAALDECHQELTQMYAQSVQVGAAMSDGVDRRLSEAELARDALRADLKALEVEAGHLRNDNRQLHDTLEQIRTSTSWKMTEPLRRLRGAPNTIGDDMTK